jgi:hypothetical protein
MTAKLQSRLLVPELRRSRLHGIDRASRREVGRVQLRGGELGGLAITPDGVAYTPRVFAVSRAVTP